MGPWLHEFEGERTVAQRYTHELLRAYFNFDCKAVLSLTTPDVRYTLCNKGFPAFKDKQFRNHEDLRTVLLFMRRVWRMEAFHPSDIRSRDNNSAFVSVDFTYILRPQKLPISGSMGLTVHACGDGITSIHENHDEGEFVARVQMERERLSRH